METEYHCHAPPAPPCLLWDHFLLPPSTIFTCRDIQEVWRVKTIAYAHALQYWVEKSNPPTGGQPCQLAKSAKELKEEMRCYLSFMDQEVLEGMIPPRETIPDLVGESHPASKMDMMVNVPKSQPPERPHWNWPKRGKALSLPDGRRSCIHPSQWWLLESLLTLPGGWSGLIHLRAPATSLQRRQPPKPPLLHRN